jgi:RNA polymerase sigma-70 factor (ECF subfamily)
MPEANPFQDLIRRVRAGDEEAAAEVVRTYEPVVRRIVRLRLADPELRRRLDSMDICQSVLASFFVRVAMGQYELDTPEQLLKLLATMARNKLANQARQLRRERPGEQHVWQASPHEFIAPDASPSQQVALQELFQEARRRLSAEDRQLLEWRAEGREWTAIAADLGDSPEALRKRLARAVESVTRQLGLDQNDHE